jgi:hypothetical protein
MAETIGGSVMGGLGREFPGEIVSESAGCVQVLATGDKGKGRKLTLPDSVFDRLVLTAIKKGSTASAVAAEILDRNLPRLRIAADD